MGSNLERQEEILKEALDRAGTERDQYLDESCGDDPDFRREIEELIEAHGDAHSLLGRVQGMAKGANLSTLLEVDGVGEEPGDHIGPYQLLQKIGEGGFGAVYLAEQAEPVQRRVALKIIKAGMDSREVIARFEVERQVLAMMEHPNIAKVFDAGATERGRPYFVMELVKGVPITEYCDQVELSTRDRLALFIEVCGTVQHAHQKGIIHRDLKPSNIMVTLHEEKPVVKVIDFGIAKATEQKLTEKTLFTALGQMVGTPAYMSPEQAVMSGLDVDTRSDVFSLGVLLYELLTGTPPFDEETLRSVGYEEMRRIIREEDPPKPSNRLSSLEDDMRAQVAGRRHATPQALNRQIHGELDWIVMKALEKERSRRYQSAAGLGDDVGRYLRDEAVEASEPSRSYRLRKLARRYRATLIAGGAVLASLLLGLGFSIAKYIDEKRAREQAEAARVRAEEAERDTSKVAQFLAQMLEGVSPSVSLGRDTTLLREILDRTVERMNAELPQQPGVEAKLRLTLGRVYNDLGDYRAAEKMAQRALVLSRKLHGERHPQVASALAAVATALYRQGKMRRAEILHREALVMRRILFNGDHLEIASSLDEFGNVLMSLEQYGESEKMHREALEMRRRLLGPQHQEVATSLGNLASVYGLQQRYAKAEDAHRLALAMWKEELGPKHPSVSAELNNLAYLLHNQARFAEAEGIYRESLTIRREIFDPMNPRLATVVFNLARCLVAQDKGTEAEPLIREALAVWQVSQPDSWWTFNTMTMLGRLLQDRGDVSALAEAEELLVKGFRGMKDRKSSIPPRGQQRLMEAAQALVDLYLTRNDPGDAERAAEYRAELSAGGDPSL